MRIDLANSPRRPLPLRIVLRVMGWAVGVVPGPVQFLTYDPTMLGAGFRRYVMRGSSGRGSWSQGEKETMASLISDLNACHF